MDIRMKRSEMLAVLEKVINSKLYQDYLFREEDLNDVLNAIEQAGMLPPRCELQKLGTSDNAWEPEE